MSRATLSLVYVAVAFTAGCNDQQVWHEPHPSLERMMVQGRVDPYSYEATRRSRMPPAGTLPVDVTVSTASSAEPDRIPLPVDRAFVENGQRLYDVHCAVCHGITGEGISVVAEKLTLLPPPSLVSSTERELSVGHIHDVIHDGYGLMGGAAAELNPNEEWMVVSYVRALQIARRAEVAELPLDVRAELTTAVP